MTHPATSNNEGMDLFDLAETLWSDRRLIIICAVGCLLVGGLASVLVQPIYQTDVKYNFITVPPNTDANQLRSKFVNSFYSKVIFSEWEDQKTSDKLDYDLLYDPVMLDGIIYDRKIEDRRISIHDDRFRIMSNNPELISEVIDYANFVSSKLGDVYKSRIVEAREGKNAPLLENSTIWEMPEFAITPSLVEQMYLETMFLQELDSENRILLISRPSPPVKTNLSLSASLLFSLIIGLLFGVILTLVRSAYHKRRRALNSMVNSLTST